MFCLQPWERKMNYGEQARGVLGGGGLPIAAAASALPLPPLLLWLLPACAPRVPPATARSLRV